MSGTPTGFKKARATMIDRMGGEEAYRAHYVEMGRKGGKLSRGGGFAHPNADPSAAGKLGGMKSRRTKKIVADEPAFEEATA